MAAGRSGKRATDRVRAGLPVPDRRGVGFFFPRWNQYLRPAVGVTCTPPLATLNDDAVPRARKYAGPRCPAPDAGMCASQLWLFSEDCVVEHRYSRSDSVDRDRDVL